MNRPIPEVTVLVGKVTIAIVVKGSTSCILREYWNSSIGIRIAKKPSASLAVGTTV